MRKPKRSTDYLRRKRICRFAYDEKTLMQSTHVNIYGVPYEP